MGKILGRIKTVGYFGESDRGLAAAQMWLLGFSPSEYAQHACQFPISKKVQESWGGPTEGVRETEFPAPFMRVPKICEGECTPYDLLLESASKLYEDQFDGGVMVLIHGDAHFKEQGSGENFLYTGENGLRFTRDRAALTTGKGTLILTAKPLRPEEMEELVDEAEKTYQGILESNRRLRGVRNLYI